MSRVQLPFVIDEEKNTFLLRIATNKLCEKCPYTLDECSDETCLTADVKRIVVEGIQDYFEVEYSCPFNKGKIKITKFFMPNEKFAQNYLDEIKKLSKTNMIIDGNIVLQELLLWGRKEEFN